MQPIHFDLNLTHDIIKKTTQHKSLLASSYDKHCVPNQSMLDPSTILAKPSVAAQVAAINDEFNKETLSFFKDLDVYYNTRADFRWPKCTNVREPLPPSLLTDDAKTECDDAAKLSDAVYCQIHTAVFSVVKPVVEKRDRAAASATDATNATDAGVEPDPKKQKTAPAPPPPAAAPPRPSRRRRRRRHRRRRRRHRRRPLLLQRRRRRPHRVTANARCGGAAPNSPRKRQAARPTLKGAPPCPRHCTNAFNHRRRRRRRRRRAGAGAAKAASAPHPPRPRSPTGRRRRRAPRTRPP